MNKEVYNIHMIKELKENIKVIDKLLKLDNNNFNQIISFLDKKDLVITWMGSSYFISEIWKYFLCIFWWVLFYFIYNLRYL